MSIEIRHKLAELDMLWLIGHTTKSGGSMIREAIKEIADLDSQIEFLTKNIKTIKGISERQQEALNRASEYRSEYLDKVREQSIKISELKYRLNLENEINAIDTPMLEMLLKVAEFIKSEK